MNIMYYDQTTEAKTETSGGMVVGPFLITPEQVILIIHESKSTLCIFFCSLDCRWCYRGINLFHTKYTSS